VIPVVTAAVVEVMFQCYNSCIAVEEQNVDHELRPVVMQKTRCTVPEVVLDKAMTDHL
jgi:hypothetical protein